MSDAKRAPTAAPTATPAAAASRSPSREETVRRLVERYGTTHAEEAGIRLRDTPAPLYQLLTLCVLFSAPIRADMAVDAARELARAGLRTPRSMAHASWQHRVDALVRAHYRRYDESTSTALGEGADLVLDRYRGDLRRLRAAADGDPDRVRELLQEVPRIGPVGADIFCREAQGLWPELRPSFDRRARSAAGELGLPTSPPDLADLVDDAGDLPRLAAALVRAGLAEGDTAQELLSVE